MQNGSGRVPCNFAITEDIAIEGSFSVMVMIKCIEKSSTRMWESGWWEGGFVDGWDGLWLDDLIMMMRCR